MLLLVGKKRDGITELRDPWRIVGLLPVAQVGRDGHIAVDHLGAVVVSAVGQDPNDLCPPGHSE